jgi:2-polyprenyl-3-methyl-5-hydroxy-6-metoxy-1,4-benzoquinol methylase
MDAGQGKLESSRQSSDGTEEGTGLACPLCRNSHKEIVDQLTGLQLNNLWEAMGKNLTAEAWGPIKPETVVEQFRCKGCGFLFFDPALAGNETFYQQLEGPGYFSPHRDEFERTLTFARTRGLRRVLDVGCGSGIFLDMARERGLLTFGVELNSKAAQQARKKGHTIFSHLLSDLNIEQTGGAFDLITLFQVLEHVPDPVKTLTEAATLLRPGGFTSVAVPSATGLANLAPMDPSMWPPHHMSIWRVQDFHTLAQRLNLRLVESGGDRLLGGAIEQRWKYRNRLASIVGRPKLPGGDVIPAIIGWVYRKTGMKFVFPRLGSSVYAHLQKP